MYNCKYKNIRMKISWYLEISKYECYYEWVYKEETRNVYRNNCDNILTTHQSPKYVQRSSKGHSEDIKYPLTVF